MGDVQAFHKFKISPLSHPSALQGRHETVGNITIDRVLTEIDGITTVSCLSPSGALIDKPVVRKSGMDLHESIKQSIAQRAKSASLILGQRRMEAEPFLLKSHRIRSASMSFRGCRSAAQTHKSKSQQNTSTTGQERQDNIRRLTVVLPDVDIYSDDDADSLDYGEPDDARRVQFRVPSAPLTGHSSQGSLRVKSASSFNFRPASSSSPKNDKPSANQRSSLVKWSRSAAITASQQRQRNQCEMTDDLLTVTSLGSSHHQKEVGDEDQTTVNIRPAFTGYTDVTELLRSKSASGTHWSDSYNDSHTSTGLPVMPMTSRCKSARLYLRAPALKPLMCAEESRCELCNGDDCSGHFKACLASSEYLQAKTKSP